MPLEVYSKWGVSRCDVYTLRSSRQVHYYALLGS